MGFRSARENSDETTSQSSRFAPTRVDSEQTRSPRRSQSRSQFSPQDCEAMFGLDLYRDGMATQIQRLVDSQGAAQVRQWSDEGMTVDTMGKPRDMEAFRERQEERPAGVPRDIERRNAKSVQRSRGAHHEASKAGDTQVPDSVRDLVSSSGQQLDTGIQQAMEERMGDNLGDVRIHTGPKAAKACQDINARAFTVGNHIAFNSGEYDPSSAEGQHVLAHELAHVRQQTGGAVSMLPQQNQGLEIDPDERLERDAEQTAEQVMRGGKIGVHRMRHSEVHVQRMTADEYIASESIDGMVEAISDESELTPEEVAAIVENYRVSGTEFGGTKGHDALNLKALKEAQDLLEEADIVTDINEEMLEKLDSAELEADLEVAEMKKERGNENGDGLVLFDDPDEAFEMVEQVQQDQEKVQQRIEELDNQLKQTIGEANVRLTDKQREELKSLADQFDNEHAEQAVEILLNYMSVGMYGKGLSGLVASLMGTGPMGGVLMAMGVISVVANILPHAASMVEDRVANITDDGSTDSSRFEEE